MEANASVLCVCMVSSSAPSSLARANQDNRSHRYAAYSLVENLSWEESHAFLTSTTQKQRRRRCNRDYWQRNVWQKTRMAMPVPISQLPTETPAPYVAIGIKTHPCNTPGNSQQLPDQKAGGPQITRAHPRTSCFRFHIKEQQRMSISSSRKGRMGNGSW
jgi:hypothetical protein